MLIAKPDTDQKFYGNYRGLVVSNIDPMGAGRCRVRIYGVYDQVAEAHIPWAEYSDPFMMGTENAGGVWVPPIGSKVWVFFENGDHMQPVYWAGAPSLNDLPGVRNDSNEEEPRGAVSYPNNRAFRSPAGHLIELDDTPGQSRVRIVHKSGTQITMYENGDMDERIVGNLRRIVTGDSTEYVQGNTVRMANGTIREQSAGGSGYYSSSDIDINGSRVDINKGAMAVITAGPVEGFVVPDTTQRSARNAQVLIDEVGSGAAFDEEGEETPAGYPPPESQESVVEPTVILTPSTAAAPAIADCEIITKVDYSYRLSPSFTLKDVSIGAVFPHTIKAQGGRDISEIICNLKHLAINILEPLKAQYPGIRLNSVFRVGSGRSQHERGQAVDIQIPGAPGSAYSDMASWIVANLPFDQFILEHGKSVWLHLSYDPGLTTQRGARLTYYPRNSPNYKSGLTNYYDSGRVIT